MNYWLMKNQASEYRSHESLHNTLYWVSRDDTVLLSLGVVLLGCTQSLPKLLVIELVSVYLFITLEEEDVSMTSNLCSILVTVS